MPSTFPTSLDSFPTLTPTTRTDTAVPHAALHTLADTAIAALEDKVGIDGSAVPTSHDYRIAALEAGGGVGGASVPLVRRIAALRAF